MKTIEIRGAQRERAFLVGLDYRVRSHPARGKSASGSLTSGALAARDSAVAANLPTRPPKVPEFTAEESLAELRSLAVSAGAEIAGEFLQRRDRPDPATLIGKGKLEEISGAAASVNADLILFDHDLTASQQRNIEREIGRRVIDRTQLILDIFARHARTREGQLQVELAQLEYMLPRLAGRGIEMSQLGGGIGTRGPGETQLETDRRKDLPAHSARERATRKCAPHSRSAAAAPGIGSGCDRRLVGYTNAGKSTLFNALTQAAVLESPKMFATLDPTIRGVTLPSRRKVLLSDTVGFIRNLPHTLVSAFRATLEEVQRAAVDPPRVGCQQSRCSAEQDAQVEKVLKELEAEGKPRLQVMNKIDLLPPKQRESLRDDLRRCTFRR